METRKRVETLTPYEASLLIPKNAEFVRALLRRGQAPFGVAVPPENPRRKMELSYI